MHILVPDKNFRVLQERAQYGQDALLGGGKVGQRPVFILTLAYGILGRDVFLNKKEVSDGHARGSASHGGKGGQEGPEGDGNLHSNDSSRHIPRPL